MKKYWIFCLVLISLLYAKQDSQSTIIQPIEVSYILYGSDNLISNSKTVKLSKSKDFNDIEEIHKILSRIEDTDELEVLVDGKLFLNRTDVTYLDLENLQSSIKASIEEYFDGGEITEVLEDHAIGLTIHGADNTQFEGGIILGGPAGTDPSGIIDIRSDEARIWDGTGTIDLDYALDEGDLYVQNELEVDGTIYGWNWRDGEGNNLLYADVGIFVAENSHGQWHIQNTAPDQIVSIAGGTDISVTGTYPDFTLDYTGSIDDGDWSVSGSNLYRTTGSVGIGTSSPHSSAILDLTSSTQGFLPPRMTSTQRDEITGPSEGLIIFNTETKEWHGFDGTQWVIFQTTPVGGPTGEVFRDDFNGSTLFSLISYPFGEPNDCGHSDEVVFTNTGTEQNVQQGCYDEAELNVSLSLPYDDYQITVAWRTGVDPHEYTACDHSFFDDNYGADCTVPTRMIVVDDSVVHEVSGSQSSYSTVTVLNYTGSISTLRLCIGTAGDEADYNTWYDYVIVTRL